MVAYAGPGWKLAPSLISLFEQADKKYPDRSQKSDGSIGDQSHASKKSDHNPTGGWVHAGDVTHDPAHGFDAHAWANWLREQHNPRIAYIISNSRIADNPTWVWQPYTGISPHEHHVHVSINHTPAARETWAPWFPVAKIKDDMKVWILKGSSQDLFLVQADLTAKRKIKDLKEIPGIKTLIQDAGGEILNNGQTRTIEDLILNGIPTLP